MFIEKSYGVFICNIHIRVKMAHIRKSFYTFENYHVFSYSPQTAPSGFQHMARMMDSLILENFSPYTFTKITTTHRPHIRQGTSKKGNTTANPNPSPPSAAITRNGNMQRSKIPMQGRCILKASSFLFYSNIVVSRVL